VAAELILCMPLLGFLPWVPKLTMQLPPLASLGRDSLFFYLWHPLAFGLWASLGFTGFPMLVLAFLSMVLFRGFVVRRPVLRDIFGVQPPYVAAAPAHTTPVDLKPSEQAL